ncbi:unnamed protein product [Dovyalis caffra]|uniref:Protein DETOXIFICATION n=1 Tax=Dovyalis caffra TaxID=77055 RepID=A0AAV1SRV8_9ROSI|nr:unnamed protein product [Dovyalis caffra]
MLEYYQLIDFQLSQEFLTVYNFDIVIPNVSYKGHQHLLLCLENTEMGYSVTAVSPLHMGSIALNHQARMLIDSLLLRDSPVEDDTYDWFCCDECEKKRDPELAIYHCKDCHYIAEIECVNLWRCGVEDSSRTNQWQGDHQFRADRDRARKGAKQQQSRINGDQLREEIHPPMTIAKTVMSISDGNVGAGESSSKDHSEDGEVKAYANFMEKLDSSSHCPYLTVWEGNDECAPEIITTFGDTGFADPSLSASLVVLRTLSTLMTVSQLKGSPFYGVTGEGCERRGMKKWSEAFTLKDKIQVPRDCHFVVSNKRGMRLNTVTKCGGPISDQPTSEYALNLSSVEERLASNNGRSVSKGIFDSTGPPMSSQSHTASVQNELLMLSLPAIAGQAIEPLAQLMETAYVGRLGPSELASAGVSMSIFNILSKVFNIPRLSVATSFVAEDIARNAGKSTSGEYSSVTRASSRHASYDRPDDEIAERKSLPSVSTALVLAAAIGVFEALAMYLGSGIFLNMMGIPRASPMRIPAERFLKLRAIGASAVVVYLAIQGIFRGFKDTKTPILWFGNFSAVFLFPLLMYYFGMGVTGAAISTIISQTALSLWSVKSLNFGCYLSSEALSCEEYEQMLRFCLWEVLVGGFLLGRTFAAAMTITLSTSMAARQGALAMAAHQICLQVWLSVSRLADAQAASGQPLIASSSAKGDYSTVKEITFSALKVTVPVFGCGLITGISLAVILGVSFSSMATMFTNDVEVLAIVRSGLLFVSASQPINALAYIFDGLHCGISDFSYAAWSMMVVGAISSAFILYAPSIVGLSGVWSGLTLFMGLRTVAGCMRLQLEA